MRNKILMTLALLLTAVGGAWAAAAYYVVGNFTNWSTNDAYKMTLNTGCTSTTEYMLTLDLTAEAWIKVVKDDGQTKTWYPDGTGNAYGENGELKGAGKYTVYFRPNGDGNPDWFNGVMYVAPEPGTVTLNDTKTEASFTMPTNDVDFSYELVRDMSVSMTTQVGDGTDGYGIRLKKNEQQPGKYEPADMNVQQMMALVKVHDAIENQDLTFGVLGANCTVSIYAVDDQGEPTGNPIAFQDLVPGRYVAKAVGETTSTYEGETPYSNIFKLFEGYEVTIAAGEYATYYKDEALKVEDQEVELLTITAVESGKAVLSDASDAMPKNTPFLVHNNGTEEKTILLIPCNDPDLAVTVADEFLGTLTEKTFTDQEMGAGADFYVCNGKEFIQVRGAGTLAANKAYLRVTGNNTPASIPFRRSIDGNGEGTTGIDAIGTDTDANATWYDLGGRRLQGKPAQKGIYIKNGKKVVVK